jgi:putative sigma-54 modulation protein
MPFRVSGKNIDVGEALRGRINDRIAEAMGRYFDGGYSGHVTVAREGFGFRTECAIHLDSKITLHAEGQAADAYASADQAALRVERRLRRYHRRLKEHRSDRLDGRAALEAASYIIAAPEQDSEADLDGFTPVIIAESTTMLKQLSVSDAVMELDMTGAPVLVFPPRRARRHQYRLSARRWAFRLDRSARAGSAGSPLTALWTLPMVRRL